MDEDGAVAPLLWAGSLGPFEDAGFSDGFFDPSLGGMSVDEDGDGGTSVEAGTLWAPEDAVCEDCFCAPFLGGLIVDEPDGGTLSSDAVALGLAVDDAGTSLGGADEPLETGQTVV